MTRSESEGRALNHGGGVGGVSNLLCFPGVVAGSTGEAGAGVAEADKLGGGRR